MILSASHKLTVLLCFNSDKRKQKVDFALNRAAKFLSMRKTAMHIRRVAHWQVVIAQVSTEATQALFVSVLIRLVRKTRLQFAWSPNRLRENQSCTQTHGQPFEFLCNFFFLYVTNTVVLYAVVFVVVSRDENKTVTVGLLIFFLIFAASLLILKLNIKKYRFSWKVVARWVITYRLAPGHL